MISSNFEKGLPLSLGATGGWPGLTFQTEPSRAAAASTREKTSLSSCTARSALIVVESRVKPTCPPATGQYFDQYFDQILVKNVVESPREAHLPASKPAQPAGGSEGALKDIGYAPKLGFDSAVFESES